MPSASEIAQQLLSEADGQVGGPIARRGLGVSIVPRRLGARAVRVDGPAEQPIEYTQRSYNSGDVTYLGFGRFVIPSTPGLLTPVQTGILRPTRPFMPQKFFAPSTQFGLYIMQVLIEGTNIMASNGGIAIELFSEASYFPQMEWPDIDPSTGIEFVVANPTGAALDFAPAFYGTDVRR